MSEVRGYEGISVSVHGMGPRDIFDWQHFWRAVERREVPMREAPCQQSRDQRAYPNKYTWHIGTGDPHSEPPTAVLEAVSRLMLSCYTLRKSFRVTWDKDEGDINVESEA